MPETPSFRRKLQRSLRTCGVALASPRSAAWRYFDFPPQSAFESTLLRQAPSLCGLAFVQVGANDGRRADPLARFIDPCKWSGLMLEPLPHNFTGLERQRGGNPRLTLRQAAVDSARGKRTIYDLRPGLPGLPDWAGGLASFDRSRVVTAARELGLDDQDVVAYEVDTITWDEVWRTFGERCCDLLVLDTEGYDIALLRMAGLAARRPRLIHFEHACVSADERFTFYRELVALGYDITTQGGDTTANLITPG